MLRTRSLPAVQRAALRLPGLRLILLIALAFGGPALRAQSAPGTGSLRGQVSNAATGDNLGGATVRIHEIERTVSTERDGGYQINGLPAGTYTVSIEYPGLDPQRMTVTVNEGQIAVHDAFLSSEVYVMPEFVIAGEREGNAAASVAQRDALSITNVVTADAFGVIAKGNVGTFLQRLPGIVGTTDETDIENISLRGMDSEFTSLDIDGVRMSTGGTSRSQSAAAIPTDMIERIEVIKAPTPDTPADSLGGRINMVTKSAFDRKDRQITARLANTWSLTYGDDVGRAEDSALAPSVAFSFADSFSVFGGKRNLGIYVNTNWERVLDIRGTTDFSSFQLINDYEYPRFNNTSTALHGNDRGGAQIKVDYKFSDRFSVGTTATFNTYANRMFRTRNQVRNGAVQPSLSTDRYFVVVDGANYGTERSDRDRVSDRYQAGFNTRYNDRANKFRVDFEVSAQRSNQHETTQQANLTSNRKFNYVLNRRAEDDADPRWPRLDLLTDFYTGNTIPTTRLPASYINLNPFTDDFRDASEADLQWRRTFSKNEILRSKVDVSKTLEIFSHPIDFKTGLGHSIETNSAWRDELRGDINRNVGGYGRDLSGLLDDGWDLGGAVGRYQPGYVPDLAKINQAMGGVSYIGYNDNPADRWSFDPAMFTLDQGATLDNTLRNNRSVEESVTSTYLQLSSRFFRKLTVTGGTRFERTSLDRRQPLRDETAGVVDTPAEWATVQREQASYTNYFPSIHLRYDVTKTLVARASWGLTTGRPNWSTILGATEIDYATKVIEVPNLDLKPRVSRNYDLSLEYYFNSVGSVSVGVFRKEISNYDVDETVAISDEEAEALGARLELANTEAAKSWETETKKNLGYGEVNGVELSYTQSFSDLLPGYWRGFGFFANYTYLDTSGTFTTVQSKFLPPVETKRLTRFVPRTWNAGVSYSYGRIDLRASYNYTSAWDENRADQEFQTKVRGQRGALDFNGTFKLTPKVSLFTSLVNVTSSHGKKYRGYSEEDLRGETNVLGVLLTAGLQARY